MDSVTQEWRDGVNVALTEIKFQVGRLASDRESEKDTIERLATKFTEDSREIAKEVKIHTAEDNVRFTEQALIIAKAGSKISMVVGIGIGIQAAFGILAAVIAVLYAVGKP